MALVHKRRNANAALRVRMMIGEVLCVLVPLALTAWFCMDWRKQKTPSLPLACAALICAAAGALLSRWLHRRAAILSSGLAGERRAQELLRSLPRGYQVLTNACFTVHDSRMELDAIVIGRSGAFIVEVKNHTGTIKGRPEAAAWTQKTRFAKKKMNNPLHQLEREQRLTRQLLHTLHIACPVYGGVFFANEDVYVQVRDPRIYWDPSALARASRSLPALSDPVDPAAVCAALQRAAL